MIRRFVDWMHNNDADSTIATYVWRRFFHLNRKRYLKEGFGDLLGFL